MNDAFAFLYINNVTWHCITAALVIVLLLIGIAMLFILCKTKRLSVIRFYNTVTTVSALALSAALFRTVNIIYALPL